MKKIIYLLSNNKAIAIYFFLATISYLVWLFAKMSMVASFVRFIDSSQQDQYGRIAKITTQDSTATRLFGDINYAIKTHLIMTNNEINSSMNSIIAALIATIIIALGYLWTVRKSN